MRHCRDGQSPAERERENAASHHSGAEAAAALGAAFLRDTTANVVLAGGHALIRSVVAYAPGGSEPVLEPLLAPGTSLPLAAGRPHAALFRDIPWSTAAVAAATQARADAIGLGTATLPDWFDVDDGPSLDHLIASLRAKDDGGFTAPATRAALARLGLLSAAPCEA